MSNEQEPIIRHIPALDGIRGLAILLVFATHISESFYFTVVNPMIHFLLAIAFAGWTGVDLFFVLSGFLITGILWDTKNEPHYFRTFYARRTVRIFPLYYATLIVVFVIVPALYPLTIGLPAKLRAVTDEQIALLEATRQFWAWYAAYIPNVLFALKGESLYPGHFWTLAVEEHFYLIWPLLVFFFGRRRLMAISVGLIVASLTLRFWLVGRTTPVGIYVLTPCRLDGLALGSVLALVARGPDGLKTLASLSRITLPLLGGAWFALAIYLQGWPQYGLLPQTLGYTLTSLFFGSFLVLGVTSQRLGAALSLYPLRLLGKYSYGLYVLHVFPVFAGRRLFATGTPYRPSVVFWLARRLAQSPEMAPGKALLILDGFMFVAFVCGASMLMAIASWHLIEKRFLKLKRLFPYSEAPRHTVRPHGDVVASSRSG